MKIKMIMKKRKKIFFSSTFKPFFSKFFFKTIGFFRKRFLFSLVDNFRKKFDNFFNTFSLKINYYIDFVKYAISSKIALLFFKFNKKKEFVFSKAFNDFYYFFLCFFSDQSYALSLRDDILLLNNLFYIRFSIRKFFLSDKKYFLYKLFYF